MKHVGGGEGSTGQRSVVAENPDNPNQVLYELMEFRACRCYVHNSKQSTVKRYLAAVHFFYKMYAGWELPTSHCMIVAVGKGIDREHGMSQKKAQVWLSLTWALLSQEKQVVSSIADGGHVTWLGLVLLYFLLCRASELWAYADRKVHREFSLTRSCLTFFRGELRVPFEDRISADAVQVRFVASKTDQKRAGCTINRTRLASVGEAGAGAMGAFEGLLELLAAHLSIPGGSPLTVRLSPLGWRPFTRTEAVAAFRLMIGSSGRDPAQYALHSGRIGEETQLAAQGAPELHIHRAGRWKSRAFMTYVREAGEGAASASAALAKTG